MFANDNNGGFFNPNNSGAGFGNDGGFGGQFMHGSANNNRNGAGNDMAMMGGGQRKKNRVFAPVTMKMIHEAQPRPDDVCEIDGDSINDIIIVGRVTAKYEEPMRTLLEINDNTGVFKVIFYQKGENEVPMALKNFDYQKLMYVKVFGTIRVFKEEKAIVGTHIKKIEKFDEVTNHLLNVFVAHCIRRKGILSNRELGPQGSNMLQGQQRSGAMGAGALAGSNMLGNRFDSTQRSDKQIILNVIKEQSKNNKFVHKGDIQTMVQRTISSNDFEEALQELIGDGMICEAYEKDIFTITE